MRLRVLLGCLALVACSTAQPMGAQPLFPAMAPMPPIEMPSIQGSEVVATAVPVATVELEAAPPSTTSWRGLAKRGSRLFAQSESASDVAPSSAPTTRPARLPEMIDVEATLHLVVDDVRGAAAAIRSLARKQGAIITEDVVDEAKMANARFTLRIPAEKTDDMIARFEGLGQPRSRQVQARDIGKEYHDAELLLRNLNAAMHRYEEILKGATQISDVLAVEKELGRLRAQIEQIKGTLQWMEDRVARSTVHVYLASLKTDEAETVLVAQAKIYPGVRASYLSLIHESAVHHFLGGGLSLRFNRHFGIDAAALRMTGEHASWKYFLATMGGEVFSEFLGNGRRRFLNPYLGWRIGYAKLDKEEKLLIGGSLGVEIFKSRYVSVDLAARLYGLLGDRNYLGVEPAVSANVAF